MPNPFAASVARLAPPQQTDGLLLARFHQDRDEIAFAQLVHRHGPTVLGVCRRFLGCSHDAEDAFQATFLVLLRHANGLDERVTLGDWLHGVAVRVAMKARTTLARRRKHERAASERRVESVFDPPPHEDMSWFDRELTALPEMFRVPLVLCLVQEMPRREAAAMLGIPEGTLASRLNSARKRLTKRLRRRGLPLATAGLLVPVSNSLASEAADKVSDGASLIIHQLANEVSTAMNHTHKWSIFVATGLLLSTAGVLLQGMPIVERPPADAVVDPATEAQRADRGEITETADVTGRVCDVDGKPLPGATVMVWTAAVKESYSVLLPGCFPEFCCRGGYPDCGKRASSDANGEFVLSRLDTNLRFRLLIVREGFAPTFVEMVDPLKVLPPTKLSKRQRPQNVAQIVRGRVLGPKGEPVRDAIIAPEFVYFLDEKGNETGSSDVDRIDPLAVSNDKGEFEIAYNKPALKMMLMINAHGLAPSRFKDVATGESQQTLTLKVGSSIRGRLAPNGKPVGGAEMGIKSKSRFSGEWFAEERIGTQRDGTFHFANVPSSSDWYVYAKMNSIKQYGATEALACTSAEEGKEINVGDIEIKPGHRLRGQVALSDRKAIPKGTQIWVSGIRAWDSQVINLPSDGRFEFLKLPNDDYNINASIKGYRTSQKNPNLSWFIEGYIDSDVDDFIILLEPGVDDYTGRGAWKFRGKALRSAPRP